MCVMVKLQCVYVGKKMKEVISLHVADRPRTNMEKWIACLFLFLDDHWVHMIVMIVRGQKYWVFFQRFNMMDEGLQHVLS